MNQGSQTSNHVLILYNVLTKLGFTYTEEGGYIFPGEKKIYLGGTIVNAYFPDADDQHGLFPRILQTDFPEACKWKNLEMTELEQLREIVQKRGYQVHMSPVKDDVLSEQANSSSANSSERLLMAQQTFLGKTDVALRKKMHAEQKPILRRLYISSSNSEANQTRETNETAHNVTGDGRSQLNKKKETKSLLVESLSSNPISKDYRSGVVGDKETVISSPKVKTSGLGLFMQRVLKGSRDKLGEIDGWTGAFAALQKEGLRVHSAPRILNLETNWIYVFPGGRMPKNGGKEGEDFVCSEDKLKELAENLTGLDFSSHNRYSAEEKGNNRSVCDAAQVGLSGEKKRIYGANDSERAGLCQRKRTYGNRAHWAEEGDSKLSPTTGQGENVVGFAKAKRLVGVDFNNNPTKNVRTCSNTEPFYIDLGNMQHFYSVIEIAPPYANYAVKLERKSTTVKFEWIVKPGDLIIIHTESPTACRTTYLSTDREAIARNKHFPFKVPWSIADVLCIWKNSSTGIVWLEVRWFYRIQDLTGKSRSTLRVGKGDQLEEIVETDHVGVVEAGSALSPALVTTFDNRGQVNQLFGMPVVEFLCTKMWSVQRKVPMMPGIKSTDGSRRFSRGLIYSQFTDKFPTERNDEIKHDNLKVDKPPTLEGIFAEAIAKLSLSETKKETEGAPLLRREEEHRKILDFLLSAVRGKRKGGNTKVGGEVASEDGHRCFMLVGGPPGTGKSSTVRSVGLALRKLGADGKLPAVAFVGVNCMELSHPQDLYLVLLEKIAGRIGGGTRVNTANALVQLQKYFNGEELGVPSVPDSHDAVILVMDEMENLIDDRQSVLHNVLNWTRPCFINDQLRKLPPGLIVIGISNVSERIGSLLLPSLRSRIGTTKCIFSSYSCADMESILKWKLKPESTEYKVFELKAIEFAAKRVSASSGDIRKVLSLCRNAAELALEKFRKKDSTSGSAGTFVTVDHIRSCSVDSALGSVQRDCMCSVAPFEALVLIAIAVLCQQTRTQQVAMEDVLTKVEAMASASGERAYRSPPNWHEFLQITQRMAESRLIQYHPTEKANSVRIIHNCGSPWSMTLSLVMDVEDMSKALETTARYRRLVQKYMRQNSTLGSFGR